jgi:PST family polysaccharide transporter
MSDSLTTSWIRRFVNHPVARNALGLYGLQIAGYVIPLVTLPYLARILRPDAFGLLMFAQSFALWASLTIEYGFNLSATREIARNRGRSDVPAKTAAGVLGAKSVLLLGFIILAAVTALTVPKFAQHPAYLVWALLQTLAFGFSPFWYFLGTERVLRAVTLEFLARSAGAVLIFLVVRVPDDGWKALALQASTGCIATIMQTLWMYQEIPFIRPRWQESLHALRAGWNMFLFRGAYHIYSTANAFILGLLVSSSQVIGYYGGAERIARALQGATVPLTVALFPRISHLISQGAPRATKLARLALSLAAGTGLVLALATALMARHLVTLILGPGYEASVWVLYIFALVLPINTINGALMMQWMIPLGMERPVSAVTIGAFIVNLISAALLAPRLGHVGMAWAILIAESCKVTALVIIMVKRRLTPMTAMPKPRSASVELS